jgi:uncharacterized protein (DUF697 family)
MEETSTKTGSSKVEQANRIIRNHALGAAAVLLIPVPFLDAGLLLGAHLNLVRSLAKLYDQPFSENVGRSLVSAIVGTSVPGLVWTLTKAIPVVGVVSASAVGAASTYALGKVFVQHFESGGTFLTFDPEKVKEHYARELGKETSKPAAYKDTYEEDYSGIKP